MSDTEQQMCGDAAQTTVKSEFYNNTQLFSCIDVKAGLKHFNGATWAEL